jgi:hypothetical protein
MDAATDFTTQAQRLRDTATALRDADLTRGGDTEFLDALLSVETSMRMLTTAVANRMVVEASARNLPGVTGRSALRRYLKETLRLSGSQAWARVTDAADYGIPNPHPGNKVISRYPHVTEAQRDGAVSAEHCHRIREVMDKIPGKVERDDRDAAEAALTRMARTGTPDDVKTVGDRVLAHLDPDGSLTDNTDRARRRGLRLSNQDIDLMSALTGQLDPQTRALLDVVLAKWAAPGFNNADDEQSPRGASDRPDLDRAAIEAAAGRDHRTQQQRNHDALRAVLLSVLNAGTLKQFNGFPMHVIVTMTLEELERQVGVATTATGGRLPVPEALALAARKRLYLCLFDLEGRPLHFSHAHRTANLDQRLGLFAAERGCTGPGCPVPAVGTRGHHRNQDYACGSATGINDLTLACPAHHPTERNDGVNTPTGWHTRTGAADGPNAGRTEFVPPARVDPTRTGRVNDVQHPDRLLAQAVAEVARQREAAREYRERVVEEFEAAELAQRRRHVAQMREGGERCGCGDCEHARGP